MVDPSHPRPMRFSPASGLTYSTRIPAPRHRPDRGAWHKSTTEENQLLRMCIACLGRGPVRSVSAYKQDLRTTPPTVKHMLGRHGGAHAHQGQARSSPASQPSTSCGRGALARVQYSIVRARGCAARLEGRTALLVLMLGTGRNSLSSLEKEKERKGKGREGKGSVRNGLFYRY